MILGYEANIGLIYYGPKWSWAEMVMGRNGHGPKWLWAETTRNLVDTWNQLPSSVVEAETVNAFERRLDRHWKNQPIYYIYREAIKSTGLDPEKTRKIELELTQQVELDLLSEEDS